MRIPNLNKVFPFLSIRRKLTIAFVGLALLFLAVFGTYGYFWSVGALKEEAVARTEQQLATIRATTGNFLDAIAADLFFLGFGVVSNSSSARQLEDVLSDYLRARPEFFQLLVLDRRGHELHRIERIGDIIRIVPPGELRRLGGRFYVEQLREYNSSDVLIIPTELKKPGGPGLVPSITVALRVRSDISDLNPGMEWIIVGHLYAEDFFATLEEQIPSIDGVVAVANREGYYLYHSGKTKNWNRLLAERTTDNLFSDLDSETATHILSGGMGNIISSDNLLVSYGPLLNGGDAAQYVILRWISANAVFSRIKSLRRVMLVLGILSALTAWALGTISADQFTLPIRRLQRFARSVAVGEKPADMKVETNDELESLAKDLVWMSNALEARDEKIHQYAAMLESRMQRNEEYLTSVLQSSADAIISTDTEDIIQSWNNGAVHIFGHSEDEAIGQPIEIMMPHYLLEQGALKKLKDQVDREGFARNIETERLHKDSRKILVNLTQTLLRDEFGIVIGYSSIMKDITTQKAMELKLAESEKFSAMGRLAGGIAHQIGTPLSVISASAELILKEADSEDAVNEDVQAILYQTRHISELIDALMTFVRRKPARLEPVNLNEAIQEALQPLQARLDESGVQLVLNVDQSLPTVQADVRLLREILRNLFDNACQAMPGGGKLTVSLDKAFLMNEEGQYKDGLSAMIADTGSGVPSTDIEKIFEPFFTTREVGKGMGLGLALSRQLAEHQNGILAYEPGPIGGAVFILILPTTGS